MYLARNTDPITSHQAAANVPLFGGSHCERIVAALSEHGAMTAHEISAQTGLTVVQIDRRMVELARRGKARPASWMGAVQIRAGARVWEAL